MAQHLWREAPLPSGTDHRICEVCLTQQLRPGGAWGPRVSPICPGDDDDGGRRVRPRPYAPAGSPRVLEDA